MRQLHLHAIFLVQVMGQVLGTVHRTVLSASASEGEHEVGESAFEVTLHMGIGQLVDAVEECKYFSIVFQEVDHRLVEPCKFLVRLVAAGIVCAAAIEHVASTIATEVFGDAPLVAEAEDAHHQFVPLFAGLEAWIFAQRGKYFFQVGEFFYHTILILQQCLYAVDGRGYAGEEMGFALEVSAEAVCTQHLHQAEEHEQLQPSVECRPVHLANEWLGMGQIGVNQPFAQRLWIAGCCLPKERGKVVIDRASASALEVDEARLALRGKHHVACLEVAIEESPLS